MTENEKLDLILSKLEKLSDEVEKTNSKVDKLSSKVETIEIDEKENMESLNKKFHTLFEYLKNKF